jgi:centrin-3
MAQLTDEQRDEINEAVRLPYSLDPSSSLQSTQLLLTHPLCARQFGLFDLDKDQLIDYHEFKVALKALGFDLPKPDLLSYLTQHGIPPPPSRAGAPSQAQAPLQAQTQQVQSQQQAPVPPSRLHLTLQAFQTIASGLIAARDPREEILRAFALFDTEGKGMITLEDLRRVARELNEGLEEEELVAMIEEFDLEGKGGVGQEEFVGICMG